MKTADGQIWTAKELRSVSSTTAASPAFKQTKLTKEAAETIKSNDAEKKSRKQPKPYMMRPTQLLVSKNEDNTIGSWLRDIATICFPLFMLYILATHPLIKDIGQPHNRKLSKMELQEKILYEYNQQVNFLHAVAEYNFMSAMNGDQCCYELPNSEFAPYMPRRSALFKDRYKKKRSQPQKGVLKGNLKKDKRQPQKQVKKGWYVNARKKMITS
mmetsp:Transcript_20200/g.31541  ORF Transcript_20200/g.31541 Transcript_20200/m.31541 type:complete len:214 (-) Transcript_20200:259-900(-)